MIHGEAQEIPAPEIKEEDAVSYIANNPRSSETIMLTTMGRGIFFTEDSGEKWEQNVKEGKSQNNP